MTLTTWGRGEEEGIISHLRIKPEDVLKEEKDRIRRSALLFKAAGLESVSPTPVTFSIEGARYCKKISGRVVAAGDDYVLLDTGMRIPMRCIHQIVFN